MKRIVLVCHKDHFTSGSVGFIQDLLQTRFEVDVFPGDSNMYYLKNLVKLNREAIYVLWQTEFLAPWLLSKGIKVVAFPMYDGCHLAPKSYFRILDNAYLFNFSYGLHQKSIHSAVVSYQMNWYPPALAESSMSEKKDVLFLWQRRPKSSINEHIIADFFAPYVAQIHIHNRPDKYELESHVSRNADLYSSQSNWFKDQEDLFSLIGSSTYFVAPRESEGIGLSFLEAMRAGCIVFANKNATHNQYIYHGYNGFLIDFQSKDKQLIKSQIQEAFEIIQSGKPIAENAQKFINEGRGIWEEQSKRFLQLINTLQNSSTIAPYRRVEKIAGHILTATYFKSPKLYSMFAYLTLKAGCFTDKPILSVPKFENLLLYRFYLKLRGREE